MRTLTKMLLALSCVLLSCSTRQTPPDVELRILFDLTDKLSGFPTADDILSQLDLKNTPYQQVVIRVSAINDRDINSITTVLLEGEDEWSSNITIRRAKIAKFQRQLQQCFDAIKQTHTSTHSIIYRAVIAQANDLATSNAHRKLLAIFSNLYENADINLYDAANLRILQKQPTIIQKQFEKYEAIQPLDGIKAWLIYTAKDYSDNNHFMPIASLYRQMLQGHGATVHIAAKFQTK